jgi:hypothetical protein
MATPEEKYDLITRRLQEVLGGDSIKAILAEGRQPRGYWGAYNPNQNVSSDLLKVFTYRNRPDWKTCADFLLNRFLKF